MPQFHPWARRLAAAAVLFTAVLLVGLVLQSAGVAAGGWMAMTSTIVLCVVVLPLFAITFHARHPDDPPRRWWRRWR